MSTMAVMACPDCGTCGERAFYRIGDTLVMSRESGAHAGDGKAKAATWPPGGGSGRASPGGARPGAEPAPGRQLRGAIHRARIHRTVPDYRAAGLRSSGDRLRARPMAGRIEVVEIVPDQLPQSRRLSRGLHG